MSFTRVDIRREYRSLHRDVVNEFYTPLLSEAVLYQRAVGFFSSSALVCLTDGIRGLLENGGKLEIIASPRLTAEDLEAIRDGFDRRHDVIEQCLIRELNEPKGKFEEARLNLLSNLIAAGVLDFKIAFLEQGDEVGMFHEKLGLMYDPEGNVIAFSGSMNETANAYHLNYESIDVYTSWSVDTDRVHDKESAFAAMWKNCEPGITVLEFQSIGNAIIEKYQKTVGINLEDLDVPIDIEYKSEKKERNINVPHVPSNVVLRPYQVEAIDKWEANGFRGVFDMATGTGKTFTALAAIARLSAAVKHNLAVFIVCPYQHLVEQWCEDIVLFGMKPIVCYSASKQKRWRDRLDNSVYAFREGSMQHFCVVTTNATFITNFMKSKVNVLRGNCLIVVDEAHNFGANRAQNALPEHFKYRLALSATIERHGDEEGTAALFSYFGEKCIEYTLEDAIKSGMLTPYYYYPVLVSLNSDELAEYVLLSKQIAKAIGPSSKGKSQSDLSQSAKMLLIKRARIIAGASEKVTKLKEVMRPYADKNHMLVYCGATTIRDEGYSESQPEDSEMRQIDAVCKMLTSDLSMNVSKFTSEENAEERLLLKEKFTSGSQLQALVAIRCLDEGVNIPSIETAFILASSTNPKEYIQRRGRVLRKAKGKKYAVIYDFITLPIPLDEVDSYPEDIVKSSKSLAVRELIRMRDFSAISENVVDSLFLIHDIEATFGINPNEEGDGLFA